MKRKKQQFETRSYPAGDFQVREADGKTNIFGYAAVFDQVAYDEVIRAGAFTKTLQEQKDIHCYWNHDSSMPLGRQSNGTLELRQDGHGLWMEVQPNLDTSWGRDALAAISRGDVRGMSFGFRVTDGVWTQTEDEQDIYEIRGVALREVSPCTDPWYDQTEAHTRENTDGSTPPSGGADISESSQDETTLEAVPNADTIKAGALAVRIALLRKQNERFSP